MLTVLYGGKMFIYFDLEFDQDQQYNVLKIDKFTHQKTLKCLYERIEQLT